MNHAIIKEKTGGDMEQWEAFQAAQLCRLQLLHNDLDVEFTADPRRVLWSVEAIQKPYFTHFLDPRVNDFTENNYFWMIAKRHGHPMIVGGGRLDSFGDSAADCIARMQRRAYGLDSVDSVSAECDQKLRGKVAYLGDLYSAGTASLGRRNVRYFLGLANYCTAHHFKADCTFSFMEAADVVRGSADTNGFDERIHQPINWHTKPALRADFEDIVFRQRKSDRAYFRHIQAEAQKSILNAKRRKTEKVAKQESA